ncbi:MAG: translation elongation factor Ts [Spirochaetota bacterium]
MAVDAQDVRFLREKTGAGIMDCKKALIESSGDFDRAVRYLREKGLAEAKKRSGREAREGKIEVAYSSDRDEVLMVEMNCETDFVSRTDKYNNFVREVTETLLKRGTDSVTSIPEEVHNRVKEAGATFGENIILRKLARFRKTDQQRSILGSYIHLDGKVGVIVEFITDVEKPSQNKELGDFMKNVTLQIASMGPVSVSREDLPEELIEEQREIFMKQARESGKPEKILEKIISGRMEKFYSESCLLEQKYVKDTSITVGKYLKDVEAIINGKVEVRRFARFKLGEE